MGLLGDIFKIGGSLVGSSKKKKASRAAEAALVNAGTQAIATYDAARDASLPAYQPYQDAGNTALGQLTVGTAPGGDFNRDFTLADYQADPGLAFRISQGQRAIDASASARGVRGSGDTLKRLLRYGQEVGSDEFGAAYNRFNNDRTTRFNRLGTLADMGYRAVGDTSRIRLGTADNVAGTQTEIGNARAGGTVNRGNIAAQNWGNIGTFLGNAAEEVASGGLSSLNPFGKKNTFATPTASSYQPKLSSWMRG